MNDHHPIHVLVIDDDTIALSLAKIIFKKSGVVNTVHYIEGGEAALDFLKKRNGYEDAPNICLIYCDLHMPRFNGIELLEYLQSDPDLAGTPVIMLTSSNASTDIDVADSLGAVGWIEKPLSVEKIRESILLGSDFKMCVVREMDDQSTK